MPKKTTAVEEEIVEEKVEATEEAVEEEEEEEVEKILDKKGKLGASGVVTVTWRGQSRQYTKEIHGDAFVALAEEFAGKKDATVA